jgi:ParB-like chromosome segregation protein Spo0J
MQSKVKIEDEPIMNIQWREAETLSANAWNPNVVFSPELRLLETSILKCGWIQPIIVNPEGMIIDGFHRWKLSTQSEAIRRRYRGRVPCVVMPLTTPEAMLLTIRINRAKGSHVAFRMSEIIRELVDGHSYEPQEIAANIGATLDEIDLLYQEGVFKKKNIEAHVYSKAWYPAESRNTPKGKNE